MEKLQHLSSSACFCFCFCFLYTGDRLLHMDESLQEAGLANLSRCNLCGSRHRLQVINILVEKAMETFSAHTINICTWTRGRTCHPFEPDPGRDKLCHFPTGLRLGSSETQGFLVSPPLLGKSECLFLLDSHRLDLTERLREVKHLAQGQTANKDTGKI